jgi:lipoyl synthase
MSEPLPQRLPPWIRKSLTTDRDFTQVRSLVDVMRLHTVCEEARCPNRHECWNKGTATVMILGDTCTRSCAFCSVKSGRPQGLDTDEPRRVAAAAKGMNVRHLVITSVNRDDLPDGGAGIFAETIRRTRELIPGCAVEVLTPDFEGNREALETIFLAEPAVFNHNLETVKRLQPVIRPQANYGRSLATLRQAAAWRPALEVKSGLMVGLGETDEEIREAMRDLREAGCGILTLGQYLRPTRDHAPVQRYLEPAGFDALAEYARELGFFGIASGPFVRSSYKSEELYAEARAARERLVAGATG